MALRSLAYVDGTDRGGPLTLIPDPYLEMEVLVAEGNDANGGSVVVAFFLGTIVGAAAALLWAPGPGDETRRRLSERAREGRERATEAANKGRDFVQKQRESVSAAIDRGKEAYQEARSPKEPA